MNETIKTILIALIVVWLYNNYSKEGFDYRRYNVLEGYNNMVLTTEKGDLGSIAFPSGMIMIWTKGTNNIPSGWALCDGNNGTPNLIGKFLLGVNPDPNAAAMFRTPGMGGGSAKISVGQLPAHSHGYSDVYHVEDENYVNRMAPGYHQILDRTRQWGSADGGDSNNLGMGREKESKPIGSGEDYYPPFVTVAYIMKL
jgi:hypothetical protein